MFEIGQREVFEGVEHQVVSLGSVDEDGHLEIEEGKGILEQEERCIVLMPDDEPGRAVILQTVEDVKRREQMEELERDIDDRLQELRTELLANNTDESLTLEKVATFCRAAYGKGYVDALTDDDPHGWIEGHGYTVPRRRGHVAPGD